MQNMEFALGRKNYHKDMILGQFHSLYLSNYNTHGMMIIWLIFLTFSDPWSVSNNEIQNAIQIP